MGGIRRYYWCLTQVFGVVGIGMCIRLGFLIQGNVRQGRMIHTEKVFTQEKFPMVKPSESKVLHCGSCFGSSNSFKRDNSFVNLWSKFKAKIEIAKPS